MNTDILECGHVPSPHASFTTGYGVDPETGARSCYACCANIDRARMIETGRATLYLTRGANGRWYISNWPGSLKFEVRHLRLTPNGGGFGADRMDAWFTGPDGQEWHAVNRGDNQLARCRRKKQKTRKAA